MRVLLVLVAGCLAACAAGDGTQHSAAAARALLAGTSHALAVIESLEDSPAADYWQLPPPAPPAPLPASQPGGGDARAPVQSQEGREEGRTQASHLPACLCCSQLLLTVSNVEEAALMLYERTFSWRHSVVL